MIPIDKRKKLVTSGLFIIILLASHLATAISPVAESLYTQNIISNSSALEYPSTTQQAFVTLPIGEHSRLYFGEKNTHHHSLINTQKLNHGITGEWEFPHLKSQLQTYTTHINKNSPDSDNYRANGLTWQYQPRDRHPKAFNFTTSYLSGKNLTSDNAGDAFSFAATATINPYLNIEGEYAQSTFSSNNPYHEDNAQHAYHYTVRYYPLSTHHKKSSGQWSITLEKRMTTPHFQTIFSQNLPNDREITRLLSRYEKQQWSTEWLVAYENNNVDQQSTLTEHSRQYQFTGRYQSPETYQTNSFWRKLGRQEYMLRYHQTDKSSTSHTLTNLDDQNHYRSIQLESKHHYSSWLWFYHMSRSNSKNQTHDNNHNEAHQFTVGAQFSIKKNIVTETHMKSSYEKDNLSTVDYQEQNYFFKVSQKEGDTKNFGDLSINYQKRKSAIHNNANDNYRTLTLSSGFNRRLLQAKNTQPHINFSLSAHYKKEYGKSFDQTDSDYKILAKLDINWEGHKSQIPNGLSLK